MTDERIALICAVCVGRAVNHRRCSPTFRRIPLQILAVLVVVIATWLSIDRESLARVEPYYVLRNPSGAELRPRILIAFDTSGSMSWHPGPDIDGDGQPDALDCAWDECETPGAPGESRMSVARRAVRDLIEQTEGQAHWALMTFDNSDPPTSSPPLCDGARFTWVDRQRIEHVEGGYPWLWLTTYPGVLGKWHLCSGAHPRPFPYLRWDELGVGSVITGDDQSGPVPASPLISTAAGSIDDPSNAHRRVQWFPRFMGVRVNLNNVTDPDQSILNRTVGDYPNRYLDVWGHDFYYWPYVEGFPGYSIHRFRPSIAGHHDHGGTTDDIPGVSAATLYAPFYLDLSATATPIQDRGPTSVAQAHQTVRWKLSPFIEGGIEPTNESTPLASMVGEIPAFPHLNNEPYGHTSIASYLQFVREVPPDGVCTPTAAIVVTDGLAYPASEGGPTLDTRLAALRNELGVRTYVVGFQTTDDLDPRLHEMACAAAGACDSPYMCSNPCNDTPADDFDTCADPANPSTGCAYLPASGDDLYAALSEILGDNLQLDVASGPGNDTLVFDGSSIERQTSVTAHTEFPGWRGHVERQYCDFVDDSGNLLPQCIPPTPPPTTTRTFGPCDALYRWDAGECLQQTPFDERRIYTSDTDGTLIPLLAPGTDEASPGFTALLSARGLVGTTEPQAEATRLARFIHGDGWPGGWKLPGVALSAPVVIRRIPDYIPGALPTVNIRDPHCAGRQPAQDLPRSLEDFAQDVNSGAGLLTEPFDHPEFQEAVLIGDDLGLLHAFAFDTGNELWAYMPPFLLENADVQRQYGASNMGQPASIAQHRYGMGGTANHGLVYDPVEGIWRHLAIVGMGPGGSEYVALDVSHMSPSSPRGPFEVLWTTEDADLKPAYDPLLGQTFARPALSYRVPSDDAVHEPSAVVLLGSGYRTDASEPSQGRALILADALSGTIERQAVMPSPTRTPYDSDFAAIVDPAVATHCVSRYWAEIQEVYVADPAGRLYRWDVGGDPTNPADSGDDWFTDPTDTVGIAREATTFRACQDPSALCNADADHNADPFIYGMAVTSNDRLADVNAIDDDVGIRNEQMLLAMISGSVVDASSDGRNPGNDLHSSLYLMVDDHHQTGQEHLGLNPQAYTNQPKMVMAELGNYRGWLRMALTDIERTRSVVPFPGEPAITSTQPFNRLTRPTRAPRIRVTGLVDDDSGEVIEGVEAYEASFYVYEPPDQTCDSRFYDTATDTWYRDQGDSFEITFRVLGTAVNGFDFGFGDSEHNTDNFELGTHEQVQLVSVRQLSAGATPCAGGCGIQATTAANPGCGATGAFSGGEVEVRSMIPLTQRSLSGFTPIE